MIKDFLMRKMLEKQLKNVPKDQQEKLIAMVTQNPELFQKIATEVKAKTDSGMDQMKATMEVMKNHESELRQLNTK